MAAPRILIVRLSAIGDVVHGLPVLCALRDAIPDAHLAWLVEGRTAELLRGHRALNEVINVPKRWLKSPGEVWRLRQKLRAACFDVTIDLQGLSKSAIAAWLSGARRRLGFAGVDGREISRWLNNELVLPTAEHVIDRNLQLLQPLINGPTATRFDLPESPADAAFALQACSKSGLADDFAVINPGAGWPSKLWSTDRFAAVARHLGEANALATLVVWGGDQERAWAEQIVAQSAGHAKLAPPTSLCQLASLVRRARLFVGSDTGPLHIAAAVGTPSVGLFGPMPAGRNGPYGSRHIAVQKVCLTGTSRERRTAGPESMLAIAVAHVTAACDEILSRDARRHAA